MTDCVKVAIRARPFSVKEKAEGASECLQYFVDNNQVGVKNVKWNWFFLCNLHHYYLFYCSTN